MNETYKGKKIEFHILQSFPVTCLNRDDVGAPKTAVVGGVNRARVSSQCWKRQVRLAMQDFGIRLGVRTKYIKERIARFCQSAGAAPEQAQQAGEKIADVLVKDTLHFITDAEAETLAKYAAEKHFVPKEMIDKEIIDAHKQGFRNLKHLDGLDIALFGRMVAKATELNVEAATSFSHAISTHKAANEVEFFTALDDEKPEEVHDEGSAHMGSLEFNSATYYRYVGLDLGQLVETLGGDDDLDKAIEAFIKALYVAVPIARQKTQSGSNVWDYAKVYVRKGQRIQASFDEPVRAKGEGFLRPSIEALNQYLLKKESLSGSLFGKIAEFTWGDDEQFSIDDLIAGVSNSIR